MIIIIMKNKVGQIYKSQEKIVETQPQDTEIYKRNRLKCHIMKNLAPSLPLDTTPLFYLSHE